MQPSPKGPLAYSGGGLVPLWTYASPIEPPKQHISIIAAYTTPLSAHTGVSARQRRRVGRSLETALGSERNLVLSASAGFGPCFFAGPLAFPAPAMPSTPHRPTPVH